MGKNFLDVFKGLKYKGMYEDLLKSHKEVQIKLSNAGVKIGNLMKEKTELADKLKKAEMAFVEATKANDTLRIEMGDMQSKYEKKLGRVRDKLLAAENRLMRAIEGLTDESFNAMLAFKEGQYIYHVESDYGECKVFVDIESVRHADEAREVAAKFLGVSINKMKSANVRRFELVQFENAKSISNGNAADKTTDSEPNVPLGDKGDEAIAEN